jgi:lysophospholipase L1-like esterase
VLLEFGVRLLYPQPIDYYNFTLIQADDTRDVALGSIKSTRNERPKGYGPYVPNLSMMFGGVEVVINSHGWRDSEYSFEKPDGVTRIMVVGDSVAFGYGIQFENIFTKVLERELNGQRPNIYQVVSLAGAAANTYLQKKMIKDNVPIYTPDLVILALNVNDIVPAELFKKPKGNGDFDVSRSISRSVLRLRKTLDETFRSHSHLYFVFRERMKAILRKFAISSPSMVPVAAFDIESDYGIAAWRDTSAALLEIASDLRQRKVRFVIAILPVEMQLSEEIADIYRREYGFVFADSLVAGRPQEIISQFALGHRIACIDLLPALRRDPEKRKFFRVYGGSIDWVHPNRLGHWIIAEELKKALRPSAASVWDTTEKTIRESLSPAKLMGTSGAAG